MSELPSSFYYVVGFLIVTNLSAVGSFLWAAFRAIWWASKLEARVEEAKAMGIRAHRRIDKMESSDG